jgi:Fe-S-cluster-containing hydrogenase component 2
MDACIMGNIERDGETGLVRNDPVHCIGCGSCIALCPYGSIVKIRREYLTVEGEEEGASRRSAWVAYKCTGCPEEPVPPCVRICPTGALAAAERGDRCEPRALEAEQK